jgi:protein-tyrosine phosphatase
VKILFVCLGNICRSPTAEGVMVGMVKRAGLEAEIELDRVEAACEGLLARVRASEPA